MQTVTGKSAYRIAFAGAILASLLLIWVSLGVGIIGADGDTSNRVFFWVIAVGVIFAAVGRLKAGAMALAMFAMAAVTLLIGLCAIALGLGMPYSPPLEILGLTGFFVVLFGAAGWLFLRAAERK
ncbi:MAG: hypothetical protein IPM63_00095 [Acidobacteriota bacterium]|nr:MAG: hypothetical protein IPM63_00095 [Acidobacteriota bacterium]